MDSERRHATSETSGQGRRLEVIVDHPRLIKLKGRLIDDTAPMLTGVLKPLAPRGGVVRVDLSGLEAVDDTGFEVLLDTARSLGRRGRLVLRDPSPAIKQFIAARPCEGVDIIESDPVSPAST